MYENPLPNYFFHLANAFLSQEEVEGFDGVSETLDCEQKSTSLLLVEYCVQNADRLREAFTRTQNDDPSRDEDRPSA